MRRQEFVRTVIGVVGVAVVGGELLALAPEYRRVGEALIEMLGKGDVVRVTGRGVGRSDLIQNLTVRGREHIEVDRSGLRLGRPCRYRIIAVLAFS